jgi:hypothetical protein
LLFVLFLDKICIEDACVLDVAPCSLVEVNRRFSTLMMDAESTSETSMNFYQTARFNNTDGWHHLNIHSRENLKSHFY